MSKKLISLTIVIVLILISSITTFSGLFDQASAIHTPAENVGATSQTDKNIPSKSDPDSQEESGGNLLVSSVKFLVLVAAGLVTYFAIRKLLGEKKHPRKD